MAEYAVDISNCDREPVHLIGGIQTYGTLVAVDETDLIVRHVAENCAAILGHEPESLLGAPLSRILAPRQLAELMQARDASEGTFALSALTVEGPDDVGGGRSLDCLAHRHEGTIVVELLSPLTERSSERVPDEIHQSLAYELTKPESVEDLMQVGVRLCRLITGYDRVMAYRFHEDLHGEVIAEDTERNDAYLGLHYPASDIPQPARRQLVLNPIRVIADVDDVPAAILKLDGMAGGPPLDLSYSQLRAVSPIHIQYLKNMGVRATLTISLVVKGQLWGLIACHHYRPRRLSASAFRLCELLGGLVGNFVRSLENTEELVQTMAAEKLAFDLEIGAHSGADLASLVAERAGALMRAVDAEGLVLNCGGRSTVLGQVADPMPNLAALPDPDSDGVKVHNSLSDILALSDEQIAVTAGGAMLNISEDGKDYLFFSRSNYPRTVNWAGDPRKSVLQAGPADRPQSLTPRTSFELWEETVSGTCRPFLPATREALRIIRRALFALRSGERARQAMIDKATSEAEMARLRLQLLDAARQNSLGELASVMAHELNQPLAALMNYVGACRQVLSQTEVSSKPEVMELIDEAQAEANRAGLLVRRLKGLIESGELDPVTLDVNRLILTASQLAISASSDPEIEFRMEGAEDLPTIWADQLQLEQVIFNLVRNSIEAMQDSATKRLTAVTRVVDGMIEISIRDTGPGISDEMSAGLFQAFNSNKLGGMGIGLSLCRRIVRAHGGEIEARRTDEGAEFAFTIPVQDSGAADG